MASVNRTKVSLSGQSLTAENRGRSTREDLILASTSEPGRIFTDFLVSKLHIGAPARPPRDATALNLWPSISFAFEDEIIRDGLPTSSWRYLSALGFTRAELARFIDTSEKSIQRKENSESKMGLAEGDRTVRLLRLVGEAVEAIGDTERAMDWFRSKLRHLGGRTPLEVAATDAGARLVRESLGAIAYGGVG